MSDPAKLVINGHTYEFHPLGYDDSLVVAGEIGGALLPALGAIMDGPIGAWMAGDADLEDVLEQDLAHLLQGVKPSEVTRALGERLRRGDLRPDAIRRALSTTTRDGVLLEGEAFDAAYRGNVAESLLAAFHAVRSSGLFRLPSTSASPGEVEGPAH